MVLVTIFRFPAASVAMIWTRTENFFDLPTSFFDGFSLSFCAALVSFTDFVASTTSAARASVAPFALPSRSTVYEDDSFALKLTVTPFRNVFRLTFNASFPTVTAGAVVSGGSGGGTGGQPPAAARVGQASLVSPTPSPSVSALAGSVPLAASNALVQPSPSMSSS